MSENTTINRQLTPDEARAVLWHEGVIHWLLHEGQKSLYDSYFNCKEKIIVWNCSRRLGKCLKFDTKILTPTGPIEIQNLKIGDKVYGYNKDGTISLTNVINVINSGEKEVFDLKTHNRTIVSCTDDHVWLTKQKDSIKERKLKDFYHGIKIVRKFVAIPGGSIDEPHAYSIGALLGDGCSKQGKNLIYISSEDNSVPNAVANNLGVKTYQNCKDKNYTWVLSHENKPTLRGCYSNKRQPVVCNYYNEWIRNRYAHEKIIDIEVIKNWNRRSRLALLAGLLDTDGSVCVNQNILTIQFCSQSKSLIDAFCYLFYSLFQYQLSVIKDKRIDKYKNGCLYQIYVRNNLFSKKAIKEISPFLAKNKKKWKDDYKNLNEHNTSEDSIGIIKSDGYKAKCFDITVDNETNLYLTADGLVTHNSYTLCTLAIEACLKKKNAIIKYCCAKQVDAKKIIRPLVQEIIRTCPLDIKPVFKVYENAWIFPNGSRIEVQALDKGHSDSLRGGAVDLAIIDEAGLVKELKYIIRDVILPMTISTKGKIILASTPPLSADHEYLFFLHRAKQQGNLITKTVYDNPLIDPTELQKIIEECGGVNTDVFRREYLCHIIKSQDKSVVPEFDDLLKEKIVKNWSKPPFYNAYVSMDIGFKDLTVVLFAYYDFPSDKIIIEDEFVINGQKFTTQALADQVVIKEQRCFSDPYTGEQKIPIRFSDTDHVVINNLRQMHGLSFQPTRKDNADAARNDMRIKLAAEKIIINPRCVTLILHLEAATWNKSKTSYARSSDDTGHFDAIDALSYLIRNVEWKKNPFPKNYGLPNQNNNFQLNKNKDFAGSDQFKRIINKKINNY